VADSRRCAKLAQSQLNRRDIHGAQDTLDALRRQGARSEDVLLLESIIHLRTGELEKARAVLEAAQGFSATALRIGPPRHRHP